MGVKLYRGASSGGKDIGGKNDGPHKSASLGSGGGNSNGIKHGSDGSDDHIGGADDIRRPSRLPRLGEKDSDDNDHDSAPSAPGPQSTNSGGSKQLDARGKGSNDDTSDGQNDSVGGSRKSGSPQEHGGGRSGHQSHSDSSGASGGQHDGGFPELNDSQKLGSGHSSKNHGSTGFFGTSSAPNGAGGRGGHGQSLAGQKDRNGSIFKPSGTDKENNPSGYPVGKDNSGGQGFGVADNPRGGVGDGGDGHNGHDAGKKQGQNSGNQSHAGENHGKSENNQSDGPGDKNTVATGGGPEAADNLENASSGAHDGNDNGENENEHDGGNKGSPNRNGNGDGLNGGGNHGGQNGADGQADGKNIGDAVGGAASNVGDGSGNNAPSPSSNDGSGSGKPPQHEPPPSRPQPAPNDSGLKPHKLSSSSPPHAGDQGNNQLQPEPSPQPVTLSQPDSPSQPDPPHRSLQPLHKVTPIAAGTIPSVKSQRQPPPPIHNVYVPKPTSSLATPVLDASTSNNRLEPDNGFSNATPTVTTSGIFTTDSKTTLPNSQTSIVEITASVTWTLIVTETAIATHTGNPGIISSKRGTSKATIAGVATAAVIVTLGLIVFWILRCKRRRKLGGVASETKASSSREAQSTLIRVWRPRKSPFSTTPQPFLSLSPVPHPPSPCHQQGFHNHVQSPPPPNWNNHEDLEQGVDPFRDPVTAGNLSDNDSARETKDIADLQSFGNQFETDIQRLSVLAQFGELLTEERNRSDEKRRTPCFIYVLGSRPENPSSAPPSYRTHDD